MKSSAPFREAELAELDWFLEKAVAVVPMREVHAGTVHPSVIGMRHDVDNAIEPAVGMAAWEAARGYRSTFFILHTASYWEDKRLLLNSLECISGWGHEIGLHNNALAEASTTGQDPREILAGAAAELRSYGFKVSGTVAHGDERCYRDGKVAFVNDQMFTECVRDSLTPYPSPTPLASFGFDYDANWLPRGAYLSDSGGSWSTDFDEFTDGFPFPGQLHMLVHPDWWCEAFPFAEVVA